MITNELLNQAIEFAKKNNGCSGADLQIEFSLGYNKAGQLMDILENEGIVYPFNGGRKRKLIKTL